MTQIECRTDACKDEHPVVQNILMKLEYCGADFSGWQWQSDHRTVQGVLQENLKKFLRHDVKIVGSGRTDTGVHALAQFANFTTASGITPGEIMYRLNRMLPDDVVVLGCRAVPLTFDARRHALRRSYRYLISEKLTALHRRFSWTLARRLDIRQLQSMAAMIKLALDFSNFCKVKSRRENNQCRVIEATWSHRNGFLRFDITADRFVHNMVRLLVGTMIAVTEGAVPLAQFAGMLENEIDDKARYIAPARGLYLVAVGYERIKL